MNPKTNPKTEFTTLDRTIKGEKRTSCVFNFMLNNPALLKIILPRIKISGPKPGATKRYFIMTLPTKDTSPILPEEEFTLDESHVRVDEEFGHATSKLALEYRRTHWHYTESYKKKSNSRQTARVHCHYNYDSYLSVASDAEKIVAVEISDKAKRNSQPAVHIMQQLFSALREAREKAAANFNHIINTLEDPKANCYESIASLQKELKKCKAASDLLNSLLEDTVDCRIKRVEENVNIIIARMQASNIAGGKTPKLITKDAAQDVPPPVVTVLFSDNNAAKATPIPSQQGALKQLDANITAIEQKYADASAKDLILLNSEKDNLQDELFLLYFELKPRDRFLHASHAALDIRFRKLPTLTNRTIDYALNADAASFSLLFCAVEQQLPSSFFFDLMSQIVRKPIDHSKEEGFVTILKFLYDVSDNYRLFVLEMKTVYSSYKDTDDLVFGATFLFDMYDFKLFKLFKLLVEQFGTGDLGGIVYDHYGVPIINMVALSDKDGDLVSFLLDNGALVDGSKKGGATKDETLELNFFAHLPDKNPEEIYPRLDQTFTDYLHTLRSDIMCVDSVLYNYIVWNPNPRVDIVTRLLASTNDIMFALVASVIINSNKTVVILSKAEKAEACQMYLDMEQLKMFYDNTHKPTGPRSVKRLALLFKPLEKYIPLMDVIMNEVSRRNISIDEEKIDKMVEILDACAKTLHRKKNYLVAIFVYYAKLFLLNYKEPSAAMHFEIIRTCSSLLAVFKEDTQSSFTTGKKEYKIKLAKQLTLIQDVMPKMSCVGDELAVKFTEESVKLASLALANLMSNVSPRTSPTP